jgi:hypothetical protein
MECRELLAHLDNSVDSGVRDKIALGAEVDPYITVNVPGRGELRVRQSELDALFRRNDVNVVETVVKNLSSAILSETEWYGGFKETGGFKPIPLEKKLIEQGITQADVDALNVERKRIYDAEHRYRLARKPVVVDVDGNYPKAPPDAIDFAEPDGAKGLPIERVLIGSKNRAGDECSAHTPDGAPVYQCSAGHGYTANPYVQGCPRCFTASMSTTTARDTSDDIGGQESF